MPPSADDEQIRDKHCGDCGGTGLGHNPPAVIPLGIPTDTPTDITTDITTDTTTNTPTTTPTDLIPTDPINPSTTSSSNIVSQITPTDTPTIPTVNYAISPPTTQTLTTTKGSHPSALVLTQTSFSTVVSTMSPSQFTLTQISTTSIPSTANSSLTSELATPDHTLTIIVPVIAVLVVVCVIFFLVFRRRRKRRLAQANPHLVQLEENPDGLVIPFPILPYQINSTTVPPKHPNQSQSPVPNETLPTKDIPYAEVNRADLNSSPPEWSPLPLASPIDDDLSTRTVGERLEELEQLIMHHVSDEVATRNARANLIALRSDLHSAEPESFEAPPDYYSSNIDEQEEPDTPN